MTPRERFLALLNGKTPDRIPTDYQATAEVTQRLMRELGCRDAEALYRRLNIDGRRTFDPKYLEPRGPLDDNTDMWGVGYSDTAYATGSYREATHHPLAEARDARDVHRHAWPSADDFDYSAISRALDADDAYRIVLCGCYEPFLLYGYLRGLEQSFEDLLCNSEIADAILGHLYDFHYEYLRRIYQAGKGRIDLTYIAEDLGSQTGPLMSLEMYRRYLLGNQIKMADMARSFGVHIMYHTDGAARIFLPDLIDRVGIEILNPIQWRCPGMDRESLVRDFGRRIIFHGAIDNQHTLPFASADEVKREVQEARALFESCRWICAPCHNIQPVTPTANILTMYETINGQGS